MILQALTAYYETLQAQGKFSAPGWDDSFRVSYELRLNDAGQLVRLVPLGTTNDKGKHIPMTLRVPEHATRSSGISANLLCDTPTYLLGADEKGKPTRAVDCFKACAALHHAVLDGVDSPVARAILAYFDSWDPAQASTHPLLAEAWKKLNANANLVFGYEAPDGDYQRSTEDSAIQTAWQNYYNSRTTDTAVAQCLITGKEAPIARTHPNISGVPGAQSSGASLVSFNADAFCSYGHKQGENAPVSKYAATAYTTALNALLSDRNGHCRIIGDGNDTTAVVFWSENAQPRYSAFGCACLSSDLNGDLADAIKRLSLGQVCSFQDSILQPEEHFYVLGLSPNVARLSVRFFLRDTLGGFANNLQRFLEDTNIVHTGKDTREHLSVWALAMTTVRVVPGGSLPSPSPQLVGDLLRAVLTGTPYPITLLNSVTMRIRAERNVSRGRAAALKAFYLRNSPTELNKEVFSVNLNESTNVPYILGRLVSVLEAVQSAANPGINTTIKDRYFNSACATPAMTFPTLIKLAQKHLQKLNTANATYYNKQITELMALLPASGYPARLSLPDQGKFEIGYYHQTQKRFEKKNKEE